MEMGSVYLFSRDPDWEDVVPVPQDDGPHPVAPIAYSPEFEDAMNFLRAVLRSGEASPRALRLTARVIELNSASYTAWQLRRDIITALLLGRNRVREEGHGAPLTEDDLRKCLSGCGAASPSASPAAGTGADKRAAPGDQQSQPSRLSAEEGSAPRGDALALLRAEVAYSRQVARGSPKNYQVWHHCRWLAELRLRLGGALRGGGQGAGGEEETREDGLGGDGEENTSREDLQEKARCDKGTSGDAEVQDQASEDPEETAEEQEDDVAAWTTPHRIASDERQLAGAALRADAKNYHAWSHRQWAAQALGSWRAEVAFTAAMLREDARNNSAWSHRMFALRRRPQALGSAGEGGDIGGAEGSSRLEQALAEEGGTAPDAGGHSPKAQAEGETEAEAAPSSVHHAAWLREAAFSERAIEADADNESAWRYYRALLGLLDDRRGAGAGLQEGGGRRGGQLQEEAQGAALEPEDAPLPSSGARRGLLFCLRIVRQGLERDGDRGSGGSSGGGGCSVQALALLQELLARGQFCAEVEAVVEAVCREGRGGEGGSGEGNANAESDATETSGGPTGTEASGSGVEAERQGGSSAGESGEAGAGAGAGGGAGAGYGVGGSAGARARRAGRLVCRQLQAVDPMRWSYWQMRMGAFV